MNYTDYELIYMINEDEEMFNYFLKKYDPLFRKFSHSFVLKYKHKGIEFDDLMQHARLALCFAIDHYDPKKEVLFYTYLLVCLKKHLVNYVRNYGSKFDKYNYIVDYNEDISIYSDKTNISDEFDDYQFEQEIINFKNSLKSLDAQVFELRYNGFMYKDIASLLDISKKKVDNVLVKLRKNLEKYFLFS